MFIEKNFIEEFKYFQKKYLLKIELISDEKLIIPEYKIELLNKSKKLIDIFQHINPIVDNNNLSKNKKKEERNKKDKKEIKKSKNKS